MTQQDDSIGALLQERVQSGLRIGTRGSPLALAQAAETKARLHQAHPQLRDSDVTITVIRTSGDKIRDRALTELGGKGLFTKEIEEALLTGSIDMAVHSMKDMPTQLPDGLVIDTLLPREDPRDVLISQGAQNLAELAPGAVVGTASLRRQAQLLHRRPDLQITLLRGNVDTRLAKVAAGTVDATLLACAGLKRLGKTEHLRAALSVDEMLPAVAQGAIGIERRLDDQGVAALLTPLNDRKTNICVTAERRFLAELDGSCRTPIAAHAQLQGATLNFAGEVLSPDGQRHWRVESSGAVAQAADIGRQAGIRIRKEAGDAYPDYAS